MSRWTSRSGCRARPGEGETSRRTRPGWSGFTPEEIDAKVDLETLMQDTFKEHTLKFVIGQNDINSDADREAYVAALEKAGLAE